MSLYGNPDGVAQCKAKSSVGCKSLSSWWKPSILWKLNIWGDLGSFVLGFGDIYPTLFFPGTTAFVESASYCGYGDANLQKFLTQADWELQGFAKTTGCNFVY